MKLLSENQESVNKPCPYCKAKAGERCKIIHGNVYTIGTEPRDYYGRFLLHNVRVKDKPKAS